MTEMNKKYFSINDSGYIILKNGKNFEEFNYLRYFTPLGYLPQYILGDSDENSIILMNIERIHFEKYHNLLKRILKKTMREER